MTSPCQRAGENRQLPEPLGLHGDCFHSEGPVVPNSSSPPFQQHSLVDALRNYAVQLLRANDEKIELLNVPHNAVGISILKKEAEEFRPGPSGHERPTNSCEAGFPNLAAIQSDCAERKAELGKACASVGASASSLFSDFFTCACCGEKTRRWIVAQCDNKECVCSMCWPEYARMRFPRCKQVSVSAAVEAGGEAPEALSPVPRRNYFLKPFKL